MSCHRVATAAVAINPFVAATPIFVVVIGHIHVSNNSNCYNWRKKKIGRKWGGKKMGRKWGGK